MMINTTTKKAIELQPFDTIIGPGTIESGMVMNTVVIDAGVQITYFGSTWVVRPEEYVFTVIAKNGGEG